MDAIDKQILNILQKNCKTTIKEIGQKINMTPPAVGERIHRMESQGVITGYHAAVNDILLGKHVSAFVTVNVEPSKYDAFCKFCENAVQVVEHHHIIGVYNALLRVAVSDTHALEAFLQALGKYGISQTSTLLSTYFTYKDFPTQ